jgi:riboflavin kinase/FMN adenylyltransferase
MWTLNSDQQWHTAVVRRGDQTGRQLSYPTINLDPSLLNQDLARGVYASWVKINEQLYRGALYFGPRLVKDEEDDVLEIYLLNFDGNLYDQQVSFSLVKHIRPVRNFETSAELKQQINQDVQAVKEILHEK